MTVGQALELSLIHILLAQEVKELNARQKAQRGDGSDPALMKGLKEATAVLKDLAAVAKTLNDQGAAVSYTHLDVYKRQAGGRA